ncbi:hypothetical protein TanjilG_18205 [Lupinus angustifolius]|uniref:Uncharacterized protein n=1 Tax=Lupinus angustifolius TaxID=3871 RepID=A0A1J7HFS0_LUPAN|nr:hypothetical protein TanjilG_18205 [Lupinus angustifolius]
MVLDYLGIGQPDPNILPDPLFQMRLNFPENINTSTDEFADFVVSKPSLLRGKGLLFADQQLMVDKKTARLVSAYASDDESTFRMGYAENV